MSPLPAKNQMSTRCDKRPGADEQIMNKRSVSSVALPQTAAGPLAGLTGALSTTRGRIAGVLLGSLFVALCAQVAVPLPWTPVPMTMQPFGVLLVGLLLGPWLGAAAMTAYLLEGAAGLPVFVPGFGGLFPMGPSAGYLLSYPLVAAVVGLIAGRGRGMVRAIGAAAAGDALILAGGALWLAALTHAAASSVLRVAVLPFVPGDAIKVLLAASLGAGIFRLHRSRAGRAAR